MRISRGRVWQVIRKEFRQLLRDPRSRPILFVAPLVQLLLFGYAVNTDVRNTRTAVLDQDRTSASRALLDGFTASGYFDIVEQATRPAGLVHALDRGKATVAIEIPPGFASDLATGRSARLQILVDGTDSNTGTLALGYATQIVGNFGARWGRTPGIVSTDGSGAGAPTLALEPRAWFNPSLESRVYNVPAVIGILVLLMCLLLTAFSVVRERELGTLDQLRVSPITPAELILGKTVPVAVVGFIDLVLIAVLARLWFEIPFRGSPFVLAVASVPYIVCGLCAGLLVSTVSRTQQEAFLTMYLVFLPLTIFSGFFLPISSMPEFFQWLSYLNPVRYFLEIVRSTFLKGGGFAELWLQFLALTGMAIGGMAYAIRRFARSVA